MNGGRERVLHPRSSHSVFPPNSLPATQATEGSPVKSFHGWLDRNVSLD